MVFEMAEVDWEAFMLWHLAMGETIRTTATLMDMQIPSLLLQ